MGWFDNKSNDDRSHQDNCKWSETDHEEWDNGSYQFCKFCNGMRPFKFDRCMTCHNN
ncbi:MAG: hypothetical protein ACRCXT_22060 [Paraclostridium sp.]